MTQGSRTLCLGHQGCDGLFMCAALRMKAFDNRVMLFSLLEGTGEDAAEQPLLYS